MAFKLSKPTGQPGYMVTVYNKHWFISTEGLVFDFRVMADGVPINQDGDAGWTHFDIAQIPAQVYLCWQHTYVCVWAQAVVGAVCTSYLAMLQSLAPAGVIT